MITNNEKDVIARCAKKYKVTSILLFGSSTRNDGEYNDIDIGVKGLAPELFFKFYGELMRLIRKPIDVVDLSCKTLFTELVEKNGIRIYG